MNYALNVSMLEGEYWWGGATHDGSKMPLSADSCYSIDLRHDTRGNQGMPFFVSTMGRYIWSNSAFAISFAGGRITIEGESEIKLATAGSTLREAYLAGMNACFPFSGQCPERLFYVTPQFNTWVELRYDHSEDAILAYAQALLDNGFQPGILMIDDTWQENYGVWDFSPRRFHDPAGMVRRLHDMGFTVMLWLVPLISPDSREFRDALINQPGSIVTDAQGMPVLIQ